jgi:uncharacterized protein
MQNVYVLSHISDIDGVGSAALVKMKYNVPIDRIFFTDYTTEGIKRAEDGLNKALVKNPTLFITDLAVNDETIPIFLRILRKVKSMGGRVFWFDHHPWDKAAIKELVPLCDGAIFGENDLYCATEITRKELMLDDDFTKHFCKIVHFSDFAIKSKKKEEYELVGSYALSISLYRMRKPDEYIKALRHMVEVISGGKLLDNIVKADAERFKKLNDLNVAKMLKETYLGKNIALGFAADIQKTYACMVLIEKSKRDIGIYVNLRDHSGHMRSVKNDCSVLANKFGGGGHPHASGFPPDFKKYNNFKSKEDKKRLLYDLENTFNLIKRKSIKESSAHSKPVFG